MAHPRAARLASYALSLLVLLAPATATAEIFAVATEAELRAAIAAAAPGDTIVFTADITLTSGDLPELASSIVVDGAGHRLFLVQSDTLLLTTGSGTTSLMAPAIVDTDGLMGSVRGNGSWVLEKSGAGTLTLGGANLYTGGTFVLDGTLRVSSAQNLGLGDVGLLNSSTLAITSSATFFQNLFLLDTPSIEVAPGASVVWNGIVADLDGVGSLEVKGGGTLTLGNLFNDYSGGTIITGGSTVAVAGDGALGASSGGVTLGDAFSGGTLAINARDFLSSRSFTLSAGGGTLDVQGASDATILGTVSGSGSLTKAGTGTLTLAGANTYTGATTVAAGVLRAGATDVFAVNSAMMVNAGATLNLNNFNQTVGSLAGAGSVALGSATLTAGGSNATTLFSGGISGTGRLVKEGTGTLVLAGANTYSGGTLVSAGTLVGNSTSLQGPITNNALVVFDQAANGTYAGVMTGTGMLAKIGTGTLTLSAANSYSGGTLVTGNGALAIASDAALGAPASAVMLGDAGSGGGLVFAAGAAFSAQRSFLLGAGGGTFDTAAGSAVTLNGSIAGAGALTKGGPGTLTLTGSNTYTGGTFITGGILAGTPESIRGTIVNNASLTIDAATDRVFNGVLTGSGSFLKTGAGTLSLSGVHSLSGTTTVSAGSLALDGFLGSSVLISPGATLRASGGIGGSVNVAGSLFVVPPGAATTLPLTSASTTAAAAGDALVDPSYLTIGGSLTASEGSVIGMPLGPGTNPTVLVGGRASLSGTELTFDATLPPDQRTASFLALTALDGLAIANTTAVTTSPALVPFLKQDNRSLFVTLLNYQVPLRGEVTTPNAMSVAEVIDRIKMDATGDRADVIRELTALDDDALNLALESIAGELHASSVQLGILESESFTDLIRNQLTARTHDAKEEDADGWGGQKIRWWSQLTGEYATLGATGGARGAIARFGSGAGGMDLRLSNRWLFGAGGGFGAGNMGLRGLSGDTDFRAPRAFGYVGYKPSGFGLRGGGSASRVTYQKRRRVSFAATLPAEFGLALLTGGIHRDAESEEAGLVSDTWGEYDDSVEVRTYVLDWMVGMRQASFTRGGFSETGAAGLALSAAEQVLTLRHTDLKLHLWRKRGSYRPYVETMFRRELTDGATGMTLRFTDEPDSDFTVDGAPVPGNMFLGRGGLTMMTRVGAWTFEYAIRAAAGQTRHTADVRMRFR